MTIDIGNFSSLQVTHVTRLRVENLALLRSFRLQGRAIELFDFLVCSHQIQVLLFKTADTNAQDDDDEEECCDDHQEDCAHINFLKLVKIGNVFVQFRLI